MRAQVRRSSSVDLDDADGPPGLGLLGVPAAAGGPFEGRDDANRRDASEIHIGPLDGKGFSLAEPVAEGERCGRFPAGSFAHAQELANLCGCQRVIVD